MNIEKFKAMQARDQDRLVKQLQDVLTQDKPYVVIIAQVDKEREGCQISGSGNHVHPRLMTEIVSEFLRQYRVGTIHPN